MWWKKTEEDVLSVVVVEGGEKLSPEESVRPKHELVARAVA